MDALVLRLRRSLRPWRSAARSDHPFVCAAPATAPAARLPGPTRGATRTAPRECRMRPAVLTAFIIATALFMENMDGTVLSTSLPAIAADFHEARSC